MDKNIERQARSLINNIRTKMTHTKAGGSTALLDWLDAAKHLEELLVQPIKEAKQLEGGMSILLQCANDRKIDAIKTVREYTGMSLFAAKAAVENAPTVFRELPDPTSMFEFYNALANVGATVVLQRP